MKVNEENIVKLDNKIDTVESGLKDDITATKKAFDDKIDSLEKDLRAVLDDHTAAIAEINKKLIPIPLVWQEFKGDCLDDNDNHFDSWWYEIGVEDVSVDTCKAACA